MLSSVSRRFLFSAPSSSSLLFHSTSPLFFHHNNNSNQRRKNFIDFNDDDNHNFSRERKEPVWKKFARRSKERKMRENRHFPPPQQQQQQAYQYQYQQQQYQQYNDPYDSYNSNDYYASNNSNPAAASSSSPYYQQQQTFGRGGGGRGRGGGNKGPKRGGGGGGKKTNNDDDFDFDGGGAAGRPKAEKFVSRFGRFRVIRSVFQINLEDQQEVRTHFSSFNLRCEPQEEPLKQTAGLKTCYLDVPIALSGPMIDQLLPLLNSSRSHNNNSDDAAPPPFTIQTLRQDIMRHYRSSPAASSSSTSLTSQFINLNLNNNSSGQQQQQQQQRIEVIYFRCRGVVANSPAVSYHLCYAHANHVIQSILSGKLDEAFEYGAFVFRDVTNPPIQNPGQSEDYPSWVEYTEACRNYAAEMLAERQQNSIESGSSCYTMGREPVAEHLLANLVRTEQNVGRLPSCTTTDVGKMLNTSVSESQVLQIRTGGAWLCILKMPTHPNLHAVGISGSKKNALTMCNLHAIELAKAFPAVPVEKLNQIRIEYEKKVSEQHDDILLRVGVRLNDDNENSVSSSKPLNVIRYPMAIKLFQLFKRIGISGCPFSHSFWSPERGCHIAKLTGPFLTSASTSENEITSNNNNNNNNVINDNNDDSTPAKDDWMNEAIVDEEDNPAVIVTMSASSPQEAKLEAYSRYFEKAVEKAPELEKFLSLAADDAHIAVDADDILNISLNQNIVRKIVEADKHLGAPTKEDEEAEAGRLAPELKLDRSALKLRSHLASGFISGQAKQALADYMIQKLHGLRNSPQYLQQFAESRSRLPMALAKDQLMANLQTHRVVVISAATGGGKTTQVPQYLLDHHIERGEGPECSILVTQPRRISAISISERIAAERCEPVGDSTGYTIRLDSNPGKNITLLTTGVLLQLLRVDPALKGVKYLIIDEIHERDLHCDFSLILAKEALRLNPELRLICMSATLQSDTFSKYFDGAPVINVDGMLHPVQEFYLEDLPKLAQESRIPYRGAAPTRSTTISKPQVDPEVVASCVDIAISRLPPNSSILVFVAGWKDITEVHSACQKRCRTARMHDYILLHSSVTKDQQMQAFQRSRQGRVKIVIATNIAESGITIDDIGCVIDSGVIKEMSYTVKESGSISQNNLQKARQESSSEKEEKQPADTGSVFCLRSVAASQANCTQRRGRAGRTRGGLCFRLFTRHDFNTRRAYQVPEILRMPLEQVILQSIAMGHGDPKQFFAKALDVPSPRLLEHSIRQLRALGAIHDDFKLTWLGQWLVKMPTEPATAKMILMGATLRCLDPILTVAAAADAPILHRAMPLRPEVSACRSQIGLATMSDSCTDVMVVNSVVRDYVQADNGGGHSHYSSYGDNNNSNNNNLLPQPQPPRYARHIPRHLINWRNFEVLKKYKAQFFDVLLASGWHVSWKSRLDQDMQQQRFNSPQSYFVDRSSASENAHEVELVKAVIACALYPNVALADSKKKGKQKWTTKTKFHSKVPLGSNAVATRVNKYDVASSLHSRMFTYRNVLDIGVGEFLEDVNHTNIWALLLLAAGDDHIVFSEHYGIGVVDGWLIFKSDPKTMSSLKVMRGLMSRCLGRLLRSSSEDQMKTLQVLNEVREVIKIVLCHENAENISHLGQQQDDDDDEDEDDDENNNGGQRRLPRQQGNNQTSGGGDGWSRYEYYDDDVNTDDLEHE